TATRRPLKLKRRRQHAWILGIAPTGFRNLTPWVLTAENVVRRDRTSRGSNSLTRDDAGHGQGHEAVVGCGTGRLRERVSGSGAARSHRYAHDRGGASRSHVLGRRQGLYRLWRIHSRHLPFPRRPARFHLLRQGGSARDRKSTRLNSSHVSISYA